MTPSLRILLLAVALLGAVGCIESPTTPKMPGKYGDGGRAFPLPQGAGDKDRNGMTLRDYFASHAPASTTKIGDFTPEEVAEWNYRYADEMLRVRAANAAVEAKGGER